MKTADSGADVRGANLPAPYNWRLSAGFLVCKIIMVVTVQIKYNEN